MLNLLRFWFSFILMLGCATAMAQVEHVDSSSARNQGVSSISLSKPSSDTNHLLVAQISSTQPLSYVPTGWTVAEQENYASSNTWAYILYKQVKNGDPSSFTFQTANLSSIIASLSAFSGVDLSNPILGSSSKWAAAGTIGTNSVNVPMAGAASVVLLLRPTATAPNTPTGQTVLSRTTRSNLGASLSYENDVAVSSAYVSNSTSTGSYVGLMVVLRPESTPTNLGSCVNNMLTTTGPLNPAQWRTNVVAGNFTPSIISANGLYRLRMTEAVTNQSTLAQLQRRFPGAGNRIVVEFNYHTYGGNGADGFTVVFSDANVLPVAGAFGGSLGYAQQSSIAGFSGGWLAIGLDEYGNFTNTSEGRQGYPSGWTPPAGANTPAGAYANNVSVRGSGNGTSGYRLLANTGTLSTPIWRNTNTSATTQKFRIFIDHSDGVHAYVRVERDTSGSGNAYTTVIPKFDVKGANSGQTVVPANWIISFTGSTGAQSNNHEISNMSICADTIKPVYGEDATSIACLEPGANSPWSTTMRQPLYTKVSNQSFSLDGVVLNDAGSIETDYVRAGYTRYLQMEFFPRNPSITCEAYTSPIAEIVLTLTSTNQGRKTSGSITIPQASSDLICRIKECVDATCANYTEQIPGCSTDRFTVRPQSLVVSSNANADINGVSATAGATIKAGAPFTIQANTNTVGYSGRPDIDSTYAEWLNAPSGGIPVGGTQRGAGNLSGAFTSNAISSTGNGAKGVMFNYDDVGYFRLRPGAVRDSIWAIASNDAANNDCIVGSYSNTLSGGKYGCDIANQTVTPHMGRFIPDRLSVSNSTLQLRTDICPLGCGVFQYMDEPMAGVFTLSALNTNGDITKNYSGAFAKYAITVPNVSALGLRGVTALGVSGPSFLQGSRLNIDSFVGSWSNGVATNVRVVYTPLANVAGANKIPDGPYDLAWGIVPVDTDGVTLAPTDFNLDTDTVAGSDRYQIGVSTVRFGKVVLSNAAGSNVRALNVGITAKYWNGSAWVVNTDDNDTKIPLSSIGFGRYTGGMNASQTNIDGSKSVLTLKDGKGLIVLSAPSNGLRGSFDIGLNLSNKNGVNTGKWSGPAMNPGAGDAPTGSANLGYLSNDTLGAAYDTDPAARVTFGVYRTTDKVIDTREQY